MKPRIVLFTLALMFFVLHSIGQILITKKDTIPFGSDSTAILLVPNYRGEIFWQQSLDKKNWVTSTIKDKDSLIIPLGFNATYRAKIVDGSCFPSYSDTLEIVVADSVKTAFINNLTEIAYPDSIGTEVKFLMNKDTLSCRKINGEYVFQGDIILTESQIQIITPLKGAGIPFSEIGYYLWPGNTVYYTIEDKLKNDARIKEAINHWEELTTIRFKPRTNEYRYVNFIWDEKGCSSNLGMIINGPQQTIKIADWGTKGSVIHEIGHTVGLIHEHSRSDRDTFIKIMWSNIKEVYHNQFGVVSNSFNATDFDFTSVMLYPCYNNFGISFIFPTMTRKDNGLPFDPPRTELSSKDIITVKKMYPPVLPSVTTAEISEIAQYSAKCGGDITDDGGSTITARGVCWNTSGNPTLSNKLGFTSNGSGNGSFTSNLTGLTVNTPYYVRAYATNSKGTAYGNQVTFTTAEAIGLPTVTTNPITNISQTTATGGGNVTADGGAPVTARGICWNTTGLPTIANHKTTNGTGTGSFTSSLTGLTANTPYYVRAYATNSQGTSYGNQVTFTTSQAISLPTVTTNSITNITQTTATGGGNVTADGGAPVTARGVCWNNTGTPTLSNSKTSNGTGTGSFISNLTGLTANTPYFVRAYATNSQGTTYGDQVTFTTISATGTVADIEGNVYKTIVIGLQNWMAENLKTTKYRDGVTIPNVSNSTTWASLSTGAYCWYNNNAGNKNAYGALYNWYTVNNGKICPTGWHVPSDAEWTILSTFLGGSNVAGGKMKATTGWSSPNTGATNESGFTGIPTGLRYYSGGFDPDVSNYGAWWSSTWSNTSMSWYRVLSYDDSSLVRSDGAGRNAGFSIRCVKD